jgi:GNAT superfamily N-acetyltransferase
LKDRELSRIDQQNHDILVDTLVTGPHLEKSAECTAILRCLPEWFGIEEAILQYSSEIRHQPTFLAETSEIVAGFLNLKQHNPYTIEIHVMGIRPEFHRKGIGQALLDEAEKWAKSQGAEYMQVKTLGPSNSDPNYAKTRNFYLAMDFRPLEEFPQIWDENNPCLILVKRL